MAVVGVGDAKRGWPVGAVFFEEHVVQEGVVLIVQEGGE